MNIKKNSTGGYTAVVEIGQYTGKLRQQKRITGKTKKEVKEKYLDLINDLEQNSMLVNDEIIFINYIKKYLRYKSCTIVESSLFVTEKIITRYLLDVLYDMKIKEIDFRAVRHVLDTLIERELSPKMMKNIISVLSDILNLAVKEKIILHNPVKDLDIPRQRKSEIVVWDESDIKKFLSIRNSPKRGRYYLATLIALFTGLRKGEILALTWDKIDFEKNTISVEQIVDFTSNKIVNRTKNNSKRKVVFDSLIKEELLKHKKHSENEKVNENNLLFHTQTGKVVGNGVLNYDLKRFCRELDLPKIKFHGTRHTHATMCIHSGVNIKQLQERLGHSRASMTLDVYGHFFPDQQRELVSKIEKMFC